MPHPSPFSPRRQLEKVGHKHSTICGSSFERILFHTLCLGLDILFLADVGALASFVSLRDLARAHFEASSRRAAKPAHIKTRSRSAHNTRRTRCSPSRGTTPVSLVRPSFSYPFANLIVYVTQKTLLSNFTSVT